MLTNRTLRPLAVGVSLFVATTALACNIPVFRYALERWRPDAAEFTLFHKGPLSPDQRRSLDTLEKLLQSTDVNASLLAADVAGELTPRQRELWENLRTESELQLPYLNLRLPHPRGPITLWQGALDAAAQPSLLHSPVRQELAKRLLAGHSIVWLVVGATDNPQTQKTCQLLKQECERLSKHIPLPEGIGLPGSELFSDVPLLLKFSVLEVDPNDPREQLLVNLFHGFQPQKKKAQASEQVLIVPVFGRGRALEVIPADVAKPQLIEDVTAFLCGACSCQVKEQNPGFDLLLAADWDLQLFGESELPPPAKTIGQGDRAPVLLTIPPGR